MFHKSFLFIFLGLFFLINPGLTYAAGATLSLSPSSGTVNKSCNYSTDIMLDTGGNNTEGVDVILHYDPTAIGITSITTGSLYPDYPSKSFNNTIGTVDISGLASPNQSFNGTGKFATINYTITSTTSVLSAQVNFDFDPNNKSKTTDSNVVQTGSVTDILNSVIDGNYAIGSGLCGSSLLSTPIPGVSTPSPLPQGAPSLSPTPRVATPLPTLPGTGFQGPTLTLAFVGTFLIVLGVVLLSLL